MLHLCSSCTIDLWLFFAWLVYHRGIQAKQYKMWQSVQWRQLWRKLQVVWSKDIPFLNLWGWWCFVPQWITTVPCLSYWCVLSVLGTLLGTLLGCLTKNCKWSCWKLLPLGHPTDCCNDGCRLASSWDRPERSKEKLGSFTGTRHISPCAPFLSQL